MSSDLVEILQRNTNEYRHSEAGVQHEKIRDEHAKSAARRARVESESLGRAWHTLVAEMVAASTEGRSTVRHIISPLLDLPPDNESDYTILGQLLTERLENGGLRNTSLEILEVLRLEDQDTAAVTAGFRLAIIANW